MRMYLTLVCLCLVSLGQPAPVSSLDRGSISHQPSGLTFPESMGHFDRVSFHKNNKTGLNITVDYKVRGADMTVSIHILPSPRAMASLNAQDRLIENQISLLVQEALQDHPRARVVKQASTTIKQGNQESEGSLVVMENTEVLGAKTQPVVTKIYIFTQVRNQWTLQFNFTYPKAYDGEKDIDDFFKTYHWM